MKKVSKVFSGTAVVLSFMSFMLLISCSSDFLDSGGGIVITPSITNFPQPGSGGGLTVSNVLANGDFLLS